MKRLALDELLKWYKSNKRKPLVIWGARQVGKTYLIKTLFGDQYLDDYVYIDLKRDEESCAYFKETVDPTKYLTYIEAKFNKKISNECPLIIDEVQTCSNVLTALKYFNQDYSDLPIIVTGSLVRTALQFGDNKDVLYPVGKIHSVNLYPLGFEEYLLNTNEKLLDIIKEAYKTKKALDDGLHQVALNALYDYLSVGGMPEVLNTFLETKSYIETEEVVNDIYDNYLADMASYVKSVEQILKNRAVYENVFSQLNKKNKNFKVSQVEKGKSNRDYSNAYEWLSLAKIIHKSSNKMGKVTLPLTSDDSGLFRLYLMDESLFVHQSNIKRTDFIVRDKRNDMAGIFYENYVANELVAKDIPLYYWTGKNENEVEFIAESNGKVVPIEVKKGKGKMNSLCAFRNHNPKSLAIKISSNNYGYDKDQQLLTLPLYMTFLLADDISKGNL